MARVVFAPKVGEDFDRILALLAQFQPTDASVRITEILHAIDVLEHSPLIGRPVPDGKRELVIGRKPHGYLALYRYVEAIDTVFVLGVRSQPESGYARP